MDNVEECKAIAQALDLIDYGQVIRRDIWCSSISEVTLEVDEEVMKDIEFKLAFARNCITKGGAPEMVLMLRLRCG